MPRGRRESPRGVHAFDDPHRLGLVPRALVLDTSVVVDALVPSQPRHREASDYLNRIAPASTVYFNRLLELELAEAAFRIGLREAHPRDWRRARRDGRSRRPARSVLEGVLEAWSEALREIDWVRIELDEVADHVSFLMSDYGLSSHDAVHAGTALLAEVRDFVTLDTGFAAVPAAMLELHVDRSRVRRCREMRERAS